MKSLSEMKELKRFQGSTFDEFSRRRLIEDRDTILELTGKSQELQNEINCMNDSRDFLKMLNQYAVDNPTFPVNLRFSHLFEILAECQSRSMGMPSRNDRPPDIWDTHAISANVFVNPSASSSATLSSWTRIQSVDFLFVRTYITSCNE